MQVELPSIGRAVSMDGGSPARRRVAYSLPSSPASLAPPAGRRSCLIPRIRSEPTLQMRASRLERLYAYAPRVRASIVTEQPMLKRRLSIVIERKRLSGAPVRTEISFDGSMVLRILMLLLLLSTSTAYVAIPTAHAGRRTAAPLPLRGSRAALDTITLGDDAWLEGADPGRGVLARLLPPPGARANFVHACLAASERASMADGVLRPPRWLLSRLTEGACAAAFPHTFGAMKQWHSARASSAGSELLAAAAELEKRLASVLAPGSFEVQARVKSLPSLFEKVWLRGKRANDLLALRVVLDDSPRDEWQISPANRPHSRCLEVRDLAASLWDEQGFRDYIAAPKPNGYCSLHMQMRLPSGSNLEVQVRTRRMHEEAETGSAAHALYKQTAMHEAAQRGGWATTAPIYVQAS
mmetsp:Transcript_26805/g.81129  ORF Transcript_26805/g.81129 Transcript_26805/m.81129 type:complete len:411 (-) Transcript_26805:711-1943(-)